MILHDLKGFCYFHDNSALSDRVLRNLSRFGVIWAASVRCVMVLQQVLSGFYVIRVGSAWSQWVLHDLGGFCVIWAGSAWPQQVLHDLWLFCVFYASSKWSDVPYMVHVAVNVLIMFLLFFSNKYYILYVTDYYGSFHVSCRRYDLSCWFRVHQSIRQRSERENKVLVYV